MRSADGRAVFLFSKKIRKQQATVETAFCGYGPYFLHLFLAGVATTFLTWAGFLCLILPGIYLLVAWMFTLPLVVDKQLDFWSAMELSRKMVTKHWFKFLGLNLVFLLLGVAGALALGIGIFVAVPLIFASTMYAYEDTFAMVRQPASSPIAGAPPVIGSRSTAGAGRTWTLSTMIGLAAVVAIIGGRALFLAVKYHRQMFQPAVEVSDDPQAILTPTPVASVTPATLVGDITPPAFGPEIVSTFADSTAVKIASGQTAAVPQSLVNMNRGPERDTAIGFWMEQAGMDFAFIGAYDGFYGMTRDMDTLTRDRWDIETPVAVANSLGDLGRDITARFGDFSRMNNPTNYIYGFKTRDGAVGLLQVPGFTDNPASVQIRYKLFRPAGSQNAVVSEKAAPDIREKLSDRLEAASNILTTDKKDELLATIAADAARAGEVDDRQKSA